MFRDPSAHSAYVLISRPATNDCFHNRLDDKFPEPKVMSSNCIFCPTVLNKTEKAANPQV